MCAHRVGQLLNLSALSNDCGITHNTIESWIGILETSFIAYRLRPFHSNFNKRLIKMPKLYFYDTGIACSLLGIQDKEQLNTHPMKGALFENYVIGELLKENANNNVPDNLYFWRDKTGNEIDCVIDQYPNVKLIEMKSGKTITQEFFGGFKYWNHIKNAPKTLNYLIYGGLEKQSRDIATILDWSSVDEIQ